MKSPFTHMLEVRSIMTQETRDYDYIVLGLGGIGSGAAY